MQRTIFIQRSPQPVDSISVQRLVAAQERQVFSEALRHEQAVEGIAVVKWKLRKRGEEQFHSM